MNLGFAVDGAINKEKQADRVTTNQIKAFRAACQRFIIAMLTKPLKSPIGSMFLRCSTILDP